MLTLCMPREEKQVSIKYIDSSNKYKKVDLFDGDEIFITNIKNIKKINDNENNELIITDYLYDPFEIYIELINTIIVWLKDHPRDIELIKFKQKDLGYIKNQLLKKNLLPCLSQFINLKDEVFIRHGLEISDSKNYEKNMSFPITNAKCWNNGNLYFDEKKNKSYWSKEPPKKNCKTCYPVEIDMFPFCINLNAYKNRKWPSDKQYGYCSNHDALFSWNKLKGYISHDKFIKNGGKIVQSHKRDHLYATSQINTYEWMFVFQNINNTKENSKYWGWTQKNFNETQFKNDIRKILNNGGGIISQELLFILYKKLFK